MPSLVCPGCSRALNVPNALAGKRVRCPACATALTIPPRPPSREAPTGPPAPRGPVAEALAPGDERAPPGYEILGELGRGGMGVVYKARHRGLKRLVALKMILSGPHAGPDELARFQTEAEAIARLQHPGIVTVHEVGRHAGHAFLALEFCAGGSLENRLAGKPMRPAEAAALALKLAEAVQAAHEANVIHRDLKPANVLLTDKGEPKVTDFGLARKLDEAGQTRTGAVMGTPSYMPPEQAEGRKDVGPLADVYSLGAILYECLTGRPPFKAATALDTIMLVVSEEPTAPRRLNARIPRDLETICLKCLAKRAEDRYASAKELADDLDRFLAGEPIRARPAGPLSRLLHWAKRRAVILAIGAALLTGLVGGVLAFTAFRGRPPEAAGRQTDEEAAATIKALIPAATSIPREQLEKITMGAPGGESPDDLTLTMFLLMTPFKGNPEEGEPAIGGEFTMDEKANPGDFVKILERTDGKGYCTLIRPDFITDFSCRIDGDTATGVIWFEAKGVYRGRIPYTARRTGGLWAVVEFRIDSLRVRLTRQANGQWKRVQAPPLEPVEPKRKMFEPKVKRPGRGD